MDKKGYTENRLSVLSTVPQSTINSMFKKNNMPSLPTLKLLCQALDISMSHFFYIVEQDTQKDGNLLSIEDSEASVNAKYDRFLRAYKLLDAYDQKLIANIVESLLKVK